MYRLLVHIALAVVASASSNVCQQPPYEAFLPVSELNQAATYCASNYPLVPCLLKHTETATSTVTEIVATDTITGDNTAGTLALIVSSTITATQISTSTGQTITITVAPTTTRLTVHTATSTLVLFTSSQPRRQSAVQRRHLSPRDNNVPIAPHNDLAQIPVNTVSVLATTSAPPPMLRQLYAQAGNFISTLCSCIQHSQECSTTTFNVHATVTEQITATSTAFDDMITQPIRTTVLYTVTITSTTVVDLTTTVAPLKASATVTETISCVSTTTQYCPASCTPGPVIKACAPHKIDVSSCSSFSIVCNTIMSTTEYTPAKVIAMESHGECMRACDFLDACNVFVYRDSQGLCTMYQNVDVQNIQTSEAADGSMGWRPVQKECGWT